VAGHYHSVHQDHRGIALGIYCRQSLMKYLDPDEIFEVTRQGLDYFEERFGYPYVFGKYDQLFVPEFSAGAMENAGCVTFTEQYVFRSRVTEGMRMRRCETILHEMAHMWFGDLVTMRWWDGLWLNETFATYMGNLGNVEATRFKSTLELVRDELQGRGQGAGPAPHHPPDRRGHTRRRIRAAQFRRHHV